MNFATVSFLLAAGFGVSFVVLDVSRMTAGCRWPSVHDQIAGNFTPFAVFLALFAGPALFVQAIWRMRLSGSLPIIDGVLAVVIACGWAACYGLVVTQGMRLVGLTVH